MGRVYGCEGVVDEGEWEVLLRGCDENEGWGGGGGRW